MLKFASLTLAQKKCVVAYIEHSPSIKKTGRVTLKDLNVIYHEIAAKRDSGGVKVGFPNWLLKDNKLERGVYQLPVPTDAELSAYAQESTTKTKVVKAKAPKVVKVKAVKAKAPKTAVADTDEDERPVGAGRLAKIIDDSVAYDEDVEDFNEILRQNGIEV
jgi:hypothetical protein